MLETVIYTNNLEYGIFYFNLIWKPPKNVEWKDRKKVQIFGDGIFFGVKRISVNTRTLHLFPQSTYLTYKPVEHAGIGIRAVWTVSVEPQVRSHWLEEGTCPTHSLGNLKKHHEGKPKCVKKASRL